MEEWQSKHIQENITKLIKLTSCDTTFITEAIAKGLLTPEDVVAILLLKSALEKSSTFYKLIQKQSNSYETLKNILQTTNQTGALEILNQASPQNSSRFKTVGKISYDPERLLGDGSYNTKVYQGRFENKDVAVKILSLADLDFGTAFEEITTLTNLDKHQNVIHYFKVEFTKKNILIAIELCEMDLAKFITASNPNYTEAVDAIKQMTEGLAFLHSQLIVHRDLKPWNILVSYPEEGKINVKLSDFGLSRKLTEGMSEVTVTGVAGTRGWMAPEDLRQWENWENLKGKFYASKSADIFALGCIFYFVLTGGEHPFGSTFMRQANILQNKSEIDSKKIKSEIFRAEAFIWLINQMISDNPKERPKADVILAYPVFWETEKILAYFQDIYSCLGFYKDEVFDEATRIITKKEDWNWLDALDNPVKDYIKSHEAIDGTKLAHLLQVIVEMRTGCSCSNSIKKLFDNSPQKYLAYWGNSYPFLLPLLWTIYKYIVDKALVLQYYYTKGFQGDEFMDHMLIRSLMTSAKPLLKVSNQEMSPDGNKSEHCEPSTSSSSSNELNLSIDNEDEEPSNATNAESEESAQKNVSNTLGGSSVKSVFLDSNENTTDEFPTPITEDNCRHCDKHNLEHIKRNLEGANCLLTEEEFVNKILSNDTTTSIIIYGPNYIGKPLF